MKLPVLPYMKCDRGCGECCGPAPATEHEFRKVLHVARAKGLILWRQGSTCPFYQDGTCQVYDARPLGCRLFGHVQEMSCIRGYNTNIPDDAGRRLVARNGLPRRVLHEALVDLGICKTLEEALDPV